MDLLNLITFENFHLNIKVCILGTCNAVSFGDYSDTECGDSGTSYYKEFFYNNKRVQISNNVTIKEIIAKLLLIIALQIPDHAAETDMIAPNPNIRCPGWQFIELPIDPEKVQMIRNCIL